MLNFQQWDWAWCPYGSKIVIHHFFIFYAIYLNILEQTVKNWQNLILRPKKAISGQKWAKIPPYGMAKFDTKTQKRQFFPKDHIFVTFKQIVKHLSPKSWKNNKFFIRNSDFKSQAIWLAKNFKPQKWEKQSFMDMANFSIFWEYSLLLSWKFDKNT